MNTISKTSLFALLMVSACLQGPWDYTPRDPDLYRGIWITGLVIADKPVDRVCFERLHNLDEEFNNDFAFFDSVSVSVSGLFNQGQGSNRLLQDPSEPNCFRGDSLHTPQRGEDYELDAVVWWDSSGTRVRSAFAATARIPTQFVMADTARAPSAVRVDPLSLLPSSVMDTLMILFGDTLTKIGDNEKALDEFFKGEAETIQALLSGGVITYNENDTIFYLTGISSLKSHKFSSTASDDVAGVLITQHWGSDAGKSASIFDSLFGEPDTSTYYTAGTQRRLLFFPNAGGESNEYELLDSMGLPNVFFFIGKNTFYFYATDIAYSNYVQTAIAEMENTKVPKIYNIRGGKGIFSGMVLDSFVVNIVADSSTAVFNIYESGIWWCREGGSSGGHGPGGGMKSNKPEPLWNSESFCRLEYQSWCSANNFEHPSCAEAAVRVSLDSGWTWNTILEILDVDNIVKQKARSDGERRWCVANNFPEGGQVSCKQHREECSSGEAFNPCRVDLWDFCDDRSWVLTDYPQCESGVVSYCNDVPTAAVVVCREAQRICGESPETGGCGS